MTLEEAKKKVKIENYETYPYGIHDNVDEVLELAFRYFEKEKALLEKEKALLEKNKKDGKMPFKE